MTTSSQSYSKELGIRVYNRSSLSLADYLFAHGDKQIVDEKEDTVLQTVIIGQRASFHRDKEPGWNDREVRCFLFGKISYSGKKVGLMVLPAIGYFETGSDVNMHNKRRIMSPILKKADVDAMEAIAIGDGSTLNFGKGGGLRNVEV